MLLCGRILEGAQSFAEVVHYVPQRDDPIREKLLARFDPRMEAGVMQSLLESPLDTVKAMHRDVSRFYLPCTLVFT